MDPDVARLVREQRLLDAARLASDRGDARDASEIFERACEWKSAAAEAMRAGDASRALELALCAGDEAIASRALALIRDPVTAETVAARLADKEHYVWAARLLEGCGRQVDAARLWERGGDAPRAAALLESAGEAHEAARVLHDAMQRDPEAWAVAVALGTMLARLGKWEAAVRWLQRVPTTAPERSKALVPLARALEKLGLAGAAREARNELAQLIGRSPAFAFAGGSPSVHRSTAGPETPASAGERPSGTREAPPVEPGERRSGMPHDSASSARKCIFDHYAVVRQVASSPTAQLLECQDTVRGERVAVKVFAACEATGSGREALARFGREVRAMKSLDHPCVVPLRDFIPHGPAVVLAWMNGGTLDRMQSELGPLGPSRAIEIASAVLSALEAAHRLGIVHRDVKPTNVLFDDNGGARLGDFGVAHLLDLSTTMTSGAFGSMAYMSPEQRGGRAVTAASDIYSVGVMLREMLTGERPGLDDAPARLPSDMHRGLDARHDRAILTLTADGPTARPVGASEARALLASLAWPNAADARAVGHVRAAQDSPLAPAERVRLEPDGAVLDRWTERRIERVSLTEGSLARARAFAVADHPALQTVWRVDEGAGTIWLEALETTGIGRPLTAGEHLRLRQALAALHAAGVAHGRIDRRHVVDGPAGVVLRFGADYADATVDGDNAALDRL